MPIQPDRLRQLRGSRGEIPHYRAYHPATGKRQRAGASDQARLSGGGRRNPTPRNRAGRAVSQPACRPPRRRLHRLTPLRKENHR